MQGMPVTTALKLDDTDGSLLEAMRSALEAGRIVLVRVSDAPKRFVSKQMQDEMEEKHIWPH